MLVRQWSLLPVVTLSACWDDLWSMSVFDFNCFWLKVEETAEVRLWRRFERNLVCFLQKSIVSSRSWLVTHCGCPCHDVSMFVCRCPRNRCTFSRWLSRVVWCSMCMSRYTSEWSLVLWMSCSKFSGVPQMSDGFANGISKTFAWPNQ